MAVRENPPSERFTPPDPTNYASDPVIAERAKKVVFTGLKMAKDARANAEARWARYYAAFRAKRKKREYLGRANIVDPEPSKAVETIAARIEDSILGQRPIARGLPREKADQKQVELNESLIQYQMDTDEFERKFGSWVKNLGIYGTAIFRVAWHEKTLQHAKRVKMNDADDEYDLLKGESMSYRGPTMREVAIGDFYVGDARKETCDEQEYVIERKKVSRAYLMSLQNQGLLKNVEKIKPGAQPQIRFDDYIANSNAQVAELGWNTGLQNEWSPVEQVSICMYEGKFALNADNEDISKFKAEVDCWIWVTDCGTVLLCQENPYWHGKKTYTSSHYIRVPGEFYGIGIIDWIEDLWAELCDSHNQVLDGKNLSMNPTMFAGAGAGLTTSKLTLSPGRVIRINGDVNQLKWHVVPDVSSAGYNSIGNIRNMVRETTGATDLMQGQSAGGIDKATIFAGLLSESNMRIKSVIRNCYLMCIEPMMSKWYGLNQQFMDKETIVRVEGQKGFDWIPIRPEDLNTPMDFKGTGSGNLGTSLARNVGIQSFLQMVVPLMQAGAEIDIMELLKRVWHDVFGYTDGEAIFGGKSDHRAHDAREENMMMAQRQAVDIHPADDDIAHTKEHLALFSSTPDMEVKSLVYDHVMEHQEQAQAKEAQRQMQAAQQEAQQLGVMQQALNPNGNGGQPPAPQIGQAPLAAMGENQPGGLTGNQRAFGPDMGSVKDAGEKLAGRQG
jgi:hypothetical protein